MVQRHGRSQGSGAVVLQVLHALAPFARGTTHLWCKPRSICLAAHYGHDGQPDGPSKIVIKTVDLTECVGIPADANMADCIDLQELLVRSGRALNRKVVRGTA